LVLHCTISDSRFSGCHSDSEFGAPGIGGAIRVDYPSLDISRVCGVNCSAHGYGHFLNRGGYDSTSDLRTNTSFSQFSLISCPSPTYGGGSWSGGLEGVVCHDRNTVGNETNLNFTACTSDKTATLLVDMPFAGPVNYVLSCSFLTVVFCGTAVGINLSVDAPPEISFSNFYNNTMDNAVIYTRGKSITIKYCVFSGNSGADVKSDSGTHRMTVVSCVFSGTLQTGTPYSFSNCHWGTSTESNAVAAFDTNL
jgi:hypothetical protein